MSRAWLPNEGLGVRDVEGGAGVEVLFGVDASGGRPIEGGM